MEFKNKNAETTTTMNQPVRLECEQLKGRKIEQNKKKNTKYITEVYADVRCFVSQRYNNIFFGSRF